MVTNGATRYNLFQLYKYSRLQRPGTQDDEGMKEMIYPADDPTRARTSSQSRAQWGHISLQPLWCRITTEELRGKDIHTTLTVEWKPVFPVDSKALTVQRENGSSLGEAIVLVCHMLRQELWDLSTQSWLPKLPRTSSSPPRITQTEFALKATFQGNRVGFRCRKPSPEAGEVPT